MELFHITRSAAFSLILTPIKKKAFLAYRIRALLYLTPPKFLALESFHLLPNRKGRLKWLKKDNFIFDIDPESATKDLEFGLTAVSKNLLELTFLQGHTKPFLDQPR